MSKELSELVYEVKYEAECWVEAVRRATKAQVVADTEATAVTVFKERTLQAIDALSRHI